MIKKESSVPGERDDARALEEAMSGARKLTGPQRVRVAPAPASPGARHKRGGGSRAEPRADAGPSPFTVEQEGESWTARANGIDRAFLKKLSSPS